MKPNSPRFSDGDFATIKPIEFEGITNEPGRNSFYRSVNKGIELLSTVLIGASLLALFLPEAKGAEVAAPPTNQTASVDLRPVFMKWDLPLRLQGRRGTCSVFALTGAMEYAVAQRQQSGTLLSVEFLNWASNQATANLNDGGFFSDLWAGYVAHGICSEVTLPYLPDYNAELKPDKKTLQCAQESVTAGLQLHWIKPWNVRTGLTETQFVQIKRTLAQGWPVCGGFRWPKQAQWEQSVLQMCPPEAVFDGHSVLLVGYRDDPDQPGGGVGNGFGASEIRSGSRCGTSRSAET